MKIFIIFYYSFITTISAFCQIQVLDEKTNMPVPYVNLITNKGRLLDISDINGFFNKDRIITAYNKEKSDSVEFSHLSYYGKKIKFNSLIEKKTVYLIQKEIQLNEAQIIGELPDFLVLKGYFRSYQLDENVPKAYMDGIVEYFIPLKNRMKSLKINLIENRTFRNQKLFESKIKYYDATSGDRTGPPYLEKETALNELDRYKLIDSTKIQCKILAGKDTIGIIYSDSLNKKSIVTIKIISPGRSYERTFMDYKVKFVEFLVSEHYSMGTSKLIRKSNLSGRYEYRKQLVSHKKLKQSPLLIESFHEFYVIEKRYIYNKEYKDKDLSSFFGPVKTNCTTKYWENLESHSIPPTPTFIDDLFGNVLEKY